MAHNDDKVLQTLNLLSKNISISLNLPRSQIIHIMKDCRYSSVGRAADL